MIAMPNRHDPSPGFYWEGTIRQRIKAKKRLEAEERQESECKREGIRQAALAAKLAALGHDTKCDTSCPCGLGQVQEYGPYGELR